MAIRIVRYRRGAESSWGVVQGDGIQPIDGEYPSTRAFMLEGAARARAVASETSTPPISLGDVAIDCPITRDQQFICQAVNYHSHMRESGFDPKTSPFNIFFRKASSCLSPADTDIARPAGVVALDYEVELGLVLARDVDEPVSVDIDNLHEFVGALVVVNDVSARDVQLPEMQFYKGKSYRSFGPTGPFLVLVDRDDLAHLDALRLRLSVNGELRQDSTVSEMVHKPPATLTELSALQDLRAGDLVATGTPGGCALQAPAKPMALIAGLLSPVRRQAALRRMAKSNDRYLAPGDLIEASIRTEDGSIDLGVQRNKITG